MFYSFSPSSLFESEPVIHFKSQIEICPCCSETLNVYKSREKTAYTLHLGSFTACEIIVKCNNRNCYNERKYNSKELEMLVPFRCNFGYDVLVYVGKAMFLRHRQGEEIVEELAEKNVSASLSEVYYLAKKFIIYLATLHNIRNDSICEIIEGNGGYILHLDSFGDKGSPRIITGLDSISDIVLENAKIASERSDYIKPFLEEIKKRFGNPLAVVQDMGKGIMNAVGEVFSGVKIFICHFHFLRDIGKDLLEENYDVIRKRLRRLGTVTALRTLAKHLKEIIDADSKIADNFFDLLEGGGEVVGQSTDKLLVINIYMFIIWILEGKNLGNGYGFPFDRQHHDFTIRLNTAYSHIQSFNEVKFDLNKNEPKTLLKLETKLKEIICDEELQDAVKEMSVEIEMFDKLREAMRIAPASGNKGLNDNGGAENIKTIKEKVYEFREWFVQRDSFDENKKYQSFVAQIDKYWEKLFADPIKVTTKDGKTTIQPQRTNNILEQLFRDFNYGNMRKTGCASKEKNLKAMIANTPLVRNLKNETYMKAILGNDKTLEEAFATINSKLIRDKMEEAKFYPNKVPEKFKKLARIIDFPDKILKFMKKTA